MKSRACSKLGRAIPAHLALALALSAPAQAVDTSLNGLEVRVDDDTGSVLQLSYPATGRMLEAPANLAGILTVSYPVKDFVALQLEPRFSRAAVVQKEDGLTLSCNELGAGRHDLQLPGGKVRASVRMRAAPDGRSVILSAQVRNDSEGEVSQILFPDLRG